MSKIGKINITIPEKVKVVLAGNILNIEGPLGKKSLSIDTDIFELKINEGKKNERDRNYGRAKDTYKAGDLAKSATF